MKKKYMPITATVCLTLLVFFAQPCHAESFSQEQVGEFGFIDWLTQKVYAKGVGFLPANKTSTVQAKAMARRAALVVAQRAIIDNNFLFVVNSDNTVTRKEVTLGLQNTDVVEITSGLESGDMVVIEGNYGLEDGEEVKIREAVQ